MTDLAERPLNPWAPETDRLALAVLGKLSEELGEASAAVARCIIQGIAEVQPVTGKPNRAWLEEELADVIAGITIAVDHFGLDGDAILVRAQKKKAHLQAWHRLLTGEAEHG